MLRETCTHGDFFLYLFFFSQTRRWSSNSVTDAAAAAAVVYTRRLGANVQETAAAAMARDRGDGVGSTRAPQRRRR